MVAVIVAYIVAAAITTGGHRYVTSAAYDAAPAATFLWKKTFPLGFYAPAVLPLIVSSLVATFENVGAITSAMEVSQLPTSGPEHLTRIQVRLSFIIVRLEFAWRHYRFCFLPICRHILTS